ncbi:hypothetical protein F4779DRAFT_328417 [Xylariaceae sp. FL0662B]|nr:hypothetical protein F4779DRAFT_328417 [Xylariaceae sp. FL0662B]
MNHCQNPELEIQNLRALLEQKDAAYREAMRNKDEDLLKAKHEIFQLQSLQSQISQTPSPSILDASAVSNEFQVSSTTSAQPFHQDGLSRSNAIPRNDGVDVHNRREHASRLSHRRSDITHSVKRARTMSQQNPVSQKMDRTASNLSTKSAGPFTGNAPISPPPKTQGANPHSRSTGMMDYDDRDEPVTSYPLGYAPLMRQSTSSRHRRHDMPTVAESGSSTGLMLDPDEYFASHPFPDESSLPTDSFGPSMPTRPHDVDVPQFNLTNANVSVCGSMTSAPTYDTAPMTRQNSLMDNQSVSGAVRMMRLGSQMSQGGDGYYRESNSGSGENSPLGKRPYCSEDALIAVGSSLAPPYTHQYASSAPTDGLLASSDMERSISSTSIASTRSNSSLKARAKDTLKLQNQRAMNLSLKPKPSADENVVEVQPSVKKDGKTAITKTKYVRPKQPRVFCEQCDEHKDGFRGEHELRRHRDAKHQTNVKKWICVDPAAHGLPIGIPAVNPLSKCKACKAQKKYGAYYNAAAHLRRTHFKEKPSRQKNKGAGHNRGDEDKRGGKGGGDWPPMSELKNWMKEIWVSKYEPDEDDDGEDDVAHSNMDAESSGMDSYPADFSMPQKMTDNVYNDMGYANLVVHADVTYLNGMPLSSADFNFNNSMSPNFASDLSAYASHEPMSQFSSVVSSSATVTPITVYQETSNLEDFDFSMVYPQ